MNGDDALKRRKGKGRSVQQLLGIRSFTRYGLLTEDGELLFFRGAEKMGHVRRRIDDLTQSNDVEQIIQYY